MLSLLRIDADEQSSPCRHGADRTSVLVAPVLELLSEGEGWVREGDRVPWDMIAQTPKAVCLAGIMSGVNLPGRKVGLGLLAPRLSCDSRADFSCQSIGGSLKRANEDLGIGRS